MNQINNFANMRPLVSSYVALLCLAATVCAALPEQGAVHVTLVDDEAIGYATFQSHNQYLYWDIHHMMSRDAGTSWHNLNRQSLKLPVIADDTGEAMRITRDDEFTFHTWLSSILAQAGKLHEQSGSNLTTDRSSKVYFFKIPAAAN